MQFVNRVDNTLVGLMLMFVISPVKLGLDLEEIATEFLFADSYSGWSQDHRK